MGQGQSTAKGKSKNSTRSNSSRKNQLQQANSDSVVNDYNCIIYIQQGLTTFIGLLEQATKIIILLERTLLIDTKGTIDILADINFIARRTKNNITDATDKIRVSSQLKIIADKDGHDTIDEYEIIAYIGNSLDRLDLILSHAEELALILKKSAVNLIGVSGKLSDAKSKIKRSRHTMKLPESPSSLSSSMPDTLQLYNDKKANNRRPRKESLEITTNINPDLNLDLNDFAISRRSNLKSTSDSKSSLGKEKFKLQDNKNNKDNRDNKEHRRKESKGRKLKATYTPKPMSLMPNNG